MARGELDRTGIVAAALAIVDEAGPGALTMRRLGRALGVEGMAIYHHFAGKEQLLDGVVAALYRWPPAPTGRWRDDLRAAAHTMRDAVVDHPRAYPLWITRPVHTPAASAAREAQYDALRRAGLDGQRLIDAHRTWGSYVLGYLAVEQQARLGVGSEWRIEPSADRPLITALDRHQAGRGWTEQFDIGLDLLLDAIERLADGHTREQDNSETRNAVSDSAAPGTR